MNVDTGCKNPKKVPFLQNLTNFSDYSKQNNCHVIANKGDSENDQPVPVEKSIEFVANLKKMSFLTLISKSFCETKTLGEIIHGDYLSH